MILPTKGILPRQALLAVGAEVLRHLHAPKTVSRLWHDVTGAIAAAKSANESADHELTFDWFVLSLDLLFILGAVELHQGHLRRTAAAKELVA